MSNFNKFKKQKTTDLKSEDDLFLNSLLTISIDEIQERLNKVEVEQNKLDKVYQSKIENRDLDFIENLYLENNLKYNEIWCEYLIKQLNDVRAKNYADLFDSDDSDNLNDLYIEDMEKEEEESMQNYERLIGKLKNRFSEDTNEYVDLNDLNQYKETINNDSEECLEEMSESQNDGEEIEEELENEELQEFIMTKNMEEESYNQSIERIKQTMNDENTENYKIGMESLYQMLEKIIMKHEKYHIISQEWEKYYKKIHENNKDNLIILSIKYDFFRDNFK